MKKFAVFASGYGSNLQAVIDAVKAGTVNAALALVVGNKKDACALERARRAGIKTLFVDPKQFGSRDEFDAAILRHLKAEGIDFVVLAGYMRILTSAFVRAYPDKILNIHPSLLPEFKGGHAIRDAFEAGVKATGVTVHFVDEDVDHGPVILQEKVEISEGETLESLEKKIHAVEHRLYPKAIGLFVNNRLKIENGRVVVLRRR